MIRGIALWLAGTILLGALGTPSLAINDPPSTGGDVTGDWIVTETKSYSGVTINVAGNLTIQSGGSLTLSGVNLHINSASAGSPCKIEVQSGGKLYTDSNTKIMTSTAYNFKFMFLAGSAGTLSSTTVAKVGVMGNEFGRGVYIGSDAVRLDNCTVQNGYFGTYINSSAPTVANSTFKDCQYYGIYIEKAQPLVDNCTVRNNGHYGGSQGLYAEETYSSGRTCRISNCTIRDNEHGAYLNTNATVLFENNTIVNSTVRGLMLRKCDPTVRLNNITQNREHGIFLEESNALIERNSITGNGQASQLAAGINVFYASNPVIQYNFIGQNTDTGVYIRPFCAPTLKGNNITSNTNIGVRLDTAGAARIDGNNISQNYDGINSKGSFPQVQGNTLWANSNDGLHADGGTLLYEGNTLTGAGAAGIHALNGARMLVGNSSFTNYQWGISAEASSTVMLVNGEFSNGFKEAFKCDNTATLDWLVDARSFIDGNNAGLRGNLTVVSGGKLSLSNMRVDISSSAAITRYVDIRSGGELYLETVNFTAYDPAWNYKFTSAGKLQVLNSSVEEMGRDQGGNGENAGLFINGGSAYFLNSFVNNNYIGLVLRGASVVLDHCEMYPEVGGIDAVSSTLDASDSYLSDGTQFSTRLDQSSRVDLINTSFNRNKSIFLDESSTVNIYWGACVQVYWSSGDPAEGAAVNMTDLQGTPVLSRQTDLFGYTGWARLREVSQAKAGSTMYTPHAVNVTIGVLSSQRQVMVNRSSVIITVLDDATSPILAITSPADQSFLATQTVELRGTASDPESGIRKVEVSWNNATWYNASTTDGWATWNHTFNLVPASYTLHARATNWAGNVTRSRVAVTIEVSAPFLVIDSPKEGALTNQTPIRLDGTTSTDASVTALVNGAAANATQSMGRISGLLDLSEGLNLIEITVADRAGNFNCTTRNVTLDTVPPWILLERPPVSYSAQQSVEINGSTDGIQVSVEGMLANLSGGRFTRTVILSYGTNNNSIEVVARDAAGNLNRTVIIVIRDLTPPNIRLAAAVKDPTNQTAAWINGSTEPDAALTLQGIPVPLDAAGNFAHLYELQEGVNIITLIATDIAGNSGRRVLTVHRDTIAPALTVASPVDGSRTYDTQVEVLGSTEPGVALTINGEPVNIGLDGNFSKMHLPLLLGQNNITIVATDSAGNSRTLVIRVTRDESLPPQPPPPVTEPVKGELETLLPFLLILLIIVGGAGAGAWAVLAGRKQKAPPPRRPSGGRPMSPVEAQAARRGAAGAPPRPKTAQELYGDDYARKFSRPAAPAHSPWGQLPEPARTQAVTWGAETDTAQANQPPMEEYEPPAEAHEPPQGPAYEPAPQGPAFGPPKPAAPGEAPRHPESATKAVDSDIDDLLKKIGEVSKKK